MSVKLNTIYHPRASSKGRIFLQKNPTFTKLTSQQLRVREAFNDCKKSTNYHGGALTKELKECIGDKLRK